MSNNNTYSEILIMILANAASLNKLKSLSKKCNISKIHQGTGRSILHYISASNKFEFATDAIKWLDKEYEIDINIEDTNGKTMLFYAAEAGNKELVDYLLSSKIHINHTDDQNETAIFSIFYTYDEDMAETLLRHGLDVDIKNIEGLTILDILEEDSIDNEFDEMIQLLNQYKYENCLDKTVKIYSSPKVNKSMKEITDAESAVTPLLSDMLNLGDYRKLQSVNKETFNRLDELEINFPHFNKVISHIKEQMSLSMLTMEPYFSMKPLLMLGGPGVGKTRFNIELSKIIGTDIVVIDGGNLSGGFIIGGSSATWKESSPGKIAKQMITGRYANPIVQLDEIDKMSSQKGFDPFGPLHPLLEYSTSKSFIDEFVGVPIDCSYINWIATANDLSSIPDPILSRFLVVTIPNPSREQMVNVTKSVYTDIINDPVNAWGDNFADNLSEDIIDELSNKTPREINRLLLAAMGKVALRYIDKEFDDKINIQKSDISLSKIGQKTMIGMV